MDHQTDELSDRIVAAQASVAAKISDKEAVRRRRAFTNILDRDRWSSASGLGRCLVIAAVLAVLMGMLMMLPWVIAGEVRFLRMPALGLVCAGSVVLYTRSGVATYRCWRINRKNQKEGA